jgi:hypothetical protein
MTAPDEGPYVTLERVRTDREYRVKGAPDVALPTYGDTRAAKVIRPDQMTVTIDDGKIRYVRVYGPTVLKSGATGIVRTTSWTAYDHGSMPAWIARVIVRDGLEWATA